jgi:hypothetical protein
MKGIKNCLNNGGRSSLKEIITKMHRCGGVIKTLLWNHWARKAKIYTNSSSHSANLSLKLNNGQQGSVGAIIGKTIFTHVYIEK